MRKIKERNNLIFSCSGVKITKHALERYMQRTRIFNMEKAYHLMLEHIKKSKLIEFTSAGEEKRFVKEKNMMFICRDEIINEKKVKIIITVLIGRVAQIKDFGTTVNIEDIDYESIGIGE